MTLQECMAMANMPRILPAVKINMDNNPDNNMLKYGKKLNKHYERKERESFCARFEERRKPILSAKRHILLKACFLINRMI